MDHFSPRGAACLYRNAPITPAGPGTDGFPQGDMTMKHQRTILLASITALLVMTAGVQAAWGAPAWLPANTDLAGHTLIWENETTMVDFTDPDANVTMYAQLWLKNETTTVNLLAAAMIDKGGSLFLKSPQLSGFTGAAFEAAIASALGISQAEYDALATVWDLLVLIVNTTFVADPAVTVSQPAIANMNKAMLIDYSGTTWGFDYFLFGIAGDKVLAVFSVDIDTSWMGWLVDIGAANVSIYDQVYNIYMFALEAMLTAFLAIAALMGGAWFAPAAPAPAAAPAPSGAISLSDNDPTLDEMKAFASAWGVLANPAIPGFEVAFVAASTAMVAGLLAWKVKKGKK